MGSRLRRLPVAALVLVPALACGAPRARTAEGPVAEAVRRGIETGAAHFDHSGWDALLGRYVDPAGRVDYLGLRGERAALDAYLDAVAAARLDALGRDDLLALLIDAYNACTVRLILDHVEGDALPGSIREIDAPWTRPRCRLGGETVSLDTIEHGLIRPLFRDARIHAAVNCAAKSCPPLARWAYTGERVDAQLQAVMEDMVNSPAYVRVEGGRILASRIFDWYRSDFLGDFRDSADSLPGYLRRYAHAELRQRIDALGEDPAVEFLDYDWSLNRR